MCTVEYPSVVCVLNSLQKNDSNIILEQKVLEAYFPYGNIKRKAPHTYQVHVWMNVEPFFMSLNEK